MRFSAREDIEVPVADVFAALADFDGLVRMALRRGILVERLDRLPAPSVGMRWAIAGRYRGKLRHVTAELRVLVPGESLALRMTGGGFEADVDIDVLALSRMRTRLRTDLELRPRSIGARLLMPTLRLGRKTALRRYQAGLRSFAHRLEMRHMVRRA